MNTQKIGCQEHVEQNLGFIRDCNFDNVNVVGFQQPWNMGIRIPAPAMEGSGSGSGSGSASQQQTPSRPSSNTIMGGFQSPASALFATERFMGFSQYGSPGCSSYSPHYHKSCNNQFPSLVDSFSIESGISQDYKQNYELRNTLQSVQKSQIGQNYQKSAVKCYKIPGSLPVTQDQSNLHGNNAANIGSHFSVPFRGNQDQRPYGNSYSSPVAQPSFFQHERQSSNYSSGSFSLSSGNSASTTAALASKTRIRWTQDLHDKFVECVKRLGGAEKATPKAILKLMDTEGLTIFHVKSHLQKYRIAKYIPDSAEGKSEKRTCTSDLTQLDVKNGFTEALQLQLDVQRRLHEQLEIQRNLQLRIEEQGKQLKMMIDQQQKTNESLFKKEDLDITHFDHDPTFSLEDVEVSIAESSGNGNEFPSKIS